ncbi:hypothetical protein HPP92_020343 [Vanilla planifolia]|uniref:DUF4378 domain-containing protein n=1 Tax=Vanilla planifolia TaxID=51239 RepID=A0A835UIE0_VANPL|nr:hypothetical protein HPP92_020343 [Vanilla planifolia]
MGLEALPVAGNEDQSKRCELRRSASESRVSQDLSHLAFDKPYPISSDELPSPRGYKLASVRPLADSPQGKSIFDPKDFFPEPMHTGSIYNEIEKRLRMRGVEEPAKDLETLKQILEALHFKGLLRTKPADLNPNYDHRTRIVNVDDSPIVVIKPETKSTSQQVANQPLPMHRRSVSPRRPKPAESIPSAIRRRNARPSVPSDSSRSPSRSPIIRRPLHVEGHGASQHHRSIPTAHSPRARSDPVASISPRNPRQNKESSSKQRASSVMECDAIILSSSAKFDFERARILERCDKLLQSIAAITSSAEQVNVTDQQPSPVSVLDSSFLAEESSASPLPKRSIGFKDQLVDWEDHKETLISGADLKNGTEDAGVYLDDDYAFVANIVCELGLRHPSEDVFSVLESGRTIVGSTKASKLHRRVIFDTVTEIVERKRNVTPWAAFNSARSPWLARRGTSLPEEVWEQVRSLRERQIASEDVIDSNGKVIWREMTATVAAGEQEWLVSEAEMSEAVVHIERQLFKDLVGDTIRELAVLACRPRLPRRKLVF